MPGAVRAALCAVLLFASGCATAPDDESEAGPGRTVHDRNDYSYLEDAEEAGAWHAHDYWDGRTSDVVASGTWDAFEATSNQLGRPFVMDSGKLVYPGTSHLRIVLSWQDPLESAGDFDIKVILKSRADTTKIQKQLMRSDIPWLVYVDASDADVGHSPKSQWLFSIEVHNPSVVRRPIDVSIDYQIEVFRGEGPLPLEPPHPDHWMNKTVRHQWSKARAANGTMTPPYQGDPGTHHQGMGPIPFPAKTLRLALYLNQSDPEDRKFDPYMHWAAGNREGPPYGEYNQEHVKPTTMEKGTHADVFVEWILDVEEGMWDSPYWNRTGWNFVVVWNTNADAGPGSSLMPDGQRDPFEGEYHWLIETIRAPPVA